MRPERDLYRWAGGLLLSFWWAFALSSCTGHLLPVSPPTDPVQTAEFVIVTVTAQDTLASLAQTHLGHSDRAGWIADYHQIDRVVPGQRLVIPKIPLAFGGLRSDGYQIVPVLHYPDLQTDGAQGDALNAAAFEEQVRVLSEKGYVTVSLDRLHAFFDRGEPLPPKAVVITFDTAHTWVHEVAYPILERHGHTAALFAPVAQIGHNDRLQWDALAQLADSGWGIGASGLSGRDLTRIPPDTATDVYLKQLEDEIRLSRQMLEDYLQRPCLDFAYPGGAANDLLIALLKQYGYRIAFTRQDGPNPFFVDPFKVHRTTIDHQGTSDRFLTAPATFQAIPETRP
ncbi:polysaccharide deacetylase family protein [Desulfatitalea alkaliphila]|uniref:Polysaccharide deacetylase family protein n=1 Tax=Desulfatitalea alkaliphila TaxID=2929485 RepID=A0AA41R502_9BACT|nr:polysaccharide deacetylase family protein [Desulfatitalea alkaliphila]MCJ8501876.1 polysaccharide deacetylase family protein [Desulfatitalea alkaliphila]